MALADPDLDLLTTAEAAELLRVTPAAVSRFLERGLLTPYQVGPDEVRVRRADLDILFDPAVAATLDDEDVPIPHPRPYVPDPAAVNHELLATITPLTEEEIRRGLAAMDAARELREQMRAERGGRPLPSSWPLIREEREKR